MRLRLPILTIVAAAATAVLPATASAAFDITSPAPGGSTVLNKVKTDWAGACDAGFTCSQFELVYSRRADVDAAGRLAEFSSNDYDLDPYKSTYVGDPAPMTALSPTLNPTRWFLQAQWRQCDVDYNCTDQQTALRAFDVRHQLIRPAVKITARYKYIRKMDFQVSYTGNAPTYGVRGTVAVQKRRHGKLVWSVIYSKSQKGYGQFGKSTRYFYWSAGKVRKGTKLRVQGIITSPGMKPRTLTTYTKSV